jgi:hypothetical protein
MAQSSLSAATLAAQVRMLWNPWSSNQDQRTNNPLLILGGAAGIRVKRFDDREQFVKIE